MPPARACCPKQSWAFQDRSSRSSLFTWGSLNPEVNNSFSFSSISGHSSYISFIDCTEVADGGSRSEAEEKVYSWLYTLAQADQDLVFEYVRSTERGMFKISRRLCNGFLIQYRNNNIFQKLSLSIKLSCKIDSSKDIGSVSTSAGKKKKGESRNCFPLFYTWRWWKMHHKEKVWLIRFPSYHLNSPLP